MPIEDEEAAEAPAKPTVDEEEETEEKDEAKEGDEIEVEGELQTTISTTCMLEFE